MTGEEIPVDPLTLDALVATARAAAIAEAVAAVRGQKRAQWNRVADFIERKFAA